MSKDKRVLPGRTASPTVTAPDGRPAFLIESLPIAAGQRVRLVFESIAERFEQGVFVATEGELAIGEARSRAFALWAVKAPPEIVIEVAETDGRLVFYNIWDSGRTPSFESQSHTSGMVKEDAGGGWARYRCNDIGFHPDFTSVVFKILIEG